MVLSVAQSKKVRYPSKTTVNLVPRRPLFTRPQVVLPLFLVFLLVVSVFAKFAVVDRLTEADRVRKELALLENRLNEAREANADFDSVLREYSRYTNTGLTREELALADRMDILNLLENQVMPWAQISSVSVQGNVVTLNISGVTLDELSDLMRRLREEPLVSDVTVFRAQTASGQSADGLLKGIVITISLAEKNAEGDAPR